MLTFLRPGFAWGFLALAGVVVLYLLRRHHAAKTVPSTRLWQEALREQEASHPFQKLKRHILLPIQLLAVETLVLALMQPAWQPPAQEAEEVPVQAPAAGETWTWRGAAERPIRVAVAAGDSLFLETALKLRENVTVLRTTPEDMGLVEADVYVFVPEEGASSPLLLTTHPGETAFSWSEERTGNEQEWMLYGESALTARLTLREVAVRVWRGLSGGTPAAFLGEDAVLAFAEGEVALGFDPQDSNLPMKYDFPILVQNILTRLLPEAAGGAGLQNEGAEEALRETVEAARAAEEAEPVDGSWALLLFFFLLLLLEYGVSRYVG